MCLGVITAASVLALRRDGVRERGTFCVLSFKAGYAAVGVRGYHFGRGEDASLFAFDLRKSTDAGAYGMRPYKNMYGYTRSHIQTITVIVAAGMVRTHAGGANGGISERKTSTLSLVFPCIKFFAELFSGTSPVAMC